MQAKAGVDEFLQKHRRSLTHGEWLTAGKIANFRALMLQYIWLLARRVYVYMEITEEQIAFLRRHRIALDRILDASNLSRAEYSKLMKSKGYDLAIGVSPCKKGGHTLRNSSGHCVQCNPSYLAYRANFNDSAFLYVAESKVANLIKIGTSRIIETRQKSLNDQLYGGFNDWSIVYSIYLEGRAGLIENSLHTLLDYRKSEQNYTKDGRNQKASEIFEFRAEDAITLIKSILKL